MAFPSIVSPRYTTTSSFPIISFKSRLCQFQRPYPVHVRCRDFVATCSFNPHKLDLFHVPLKFKTYLDYAKDKLWTSTPDTVKHFPWKKAESVALQQLWATGKETLKCSFAAFVIFSCVYDIIYSISSNKELLIPLGLYVGCMITKFFDEIVQELSGDLKEKGLTWEFLCTSSLFLFVKVISPLFSVGAKVFLMHVAYGGLMQVLWHWRSFARAR